MRETPRHRSALEGLLPAPSDAAASHSAAVRVAPHHALACIVLRGRQSDAAFMNAARSVLGTDLPTRPSTFAGSSGDLILWISPDEWWLLLPRSARDERLRALTDALQDVFAQVVDNSGMLACLHLSGAEHLTVLRHLTPYDVESLAVGACVSTAIPRAALTIVRVDAGSVLLVFRRSFADWVWRLIERSAQPYGLAVGADPMTSTPTKESHVHAA